MKTIQEVICVCGLKPVLVETKYDSEYDCCMGYQMVCKCGIKGLSFDDVTHTNPKQYAVESFCHVIKYINEPKVNYESDFKNKLKGL
jgi:hypothetical protein